MFGWLKSNRVRPTASAIHDLCQTARRAYQTLGPTGASGFFKMHPFVIDHREPSNSHEGHTFRLGGEFRDFQFIVYDGKDMVQVSGGADFTGIMITTTPSGRYIVFVTRPLGVPLGRHARTLASVFVREFGAQDTSDLVPRGV